MKDQLDKGKGFLKEKLGNYQVDPPEAVWDSISSRLGGRNRRGLIILSLSAAATIALAVTLGINFFGPGLDEESGLAEMENLESPSPKQDGRLEEKVVGVLEDLSSGESDVKEEFAVETPSGMSNEETGVVEEIAKEQLSIRTEHIELDDDPGKEPGIEPGIEPGQEPGQEPAAETFAEIAADPASEPISEDATVAVSDQDPELISGDLKEDQVREVNEDEPEQEILPGPEPIIEDEKKRKKRWMLGAMMSPLYSFRDAEASAVNGASEHESGLVSYAGGVHVGYKAGKRLAIESGVFFTKMGVTIGAPGIQLFEQSFDFAPLGESANRSNVLAVTNTVGNIVSESGDIYVNNYMLNSTKEVDVLSIEPPPSPDLHANQGIRQHLDYLELPFNLRYTLIDRNIELQLVGGMSTNVLVNNYVSLETSAGTRDIGYLTNVRSVNYSGNAGFGMIYHIRDHFSLMMEPRFRYFLHSVNDASLPSTRPYTFGIYTGLSYTF